MRWLFVPLILFFGAIFIGLYFHSVELIIIGVIYLIITWFIIAPDKLFP